MTVYFLKRIGTIFGETFIMGVFTSEEKATAYRDKTIEKSDGFYDEEDFEIDEYKTDPEWL